MGEMSITVPVHRVNAKYLSLTVEIGSATIEGYPEEEKAEISMSVNASSIFVLFRDKKYMLEMAQIIPEVLDLIVAELTEEGNGPELSAVGSSDVEPSVGTAD
jgi:hypothetical protein